MIIGSGLFLVFLNFLRKMYNVLLFLVSRFLVVRLVIIWVRLLL